MAGDKAVLPEPRPQRHPTLVETRSLELWFTNS